MSTHAVRSDLMRRPLTDIPLVDFFGNVQQVELTGARYTLADRRKASSSKKETTILGEIPEPLAFQKKSSHSDDETRSSSTSDHYRKMAITIDHHLRQLFDYNTFMEDPAARLRDLLSDGKHLAGALYGTLVTADYTAGSTLPHLMPIVRKQAQTSATRRKKAESVTSGWSTIVSAVLAFVGLLTMLF